MSANHWLLWMTIPSFVLLVLLILVVAAFFLLIHITTPAPVVALDVNQALQQYRERIKGQALTDDEAATLTADFSQALEKAAGRYAAEHLAVVLVSQSVLAGATDVTASILLLTVQPTEDVA
ncbi:MAG: type-F conjugative transfer system protein TrbI [Gammaproteobacteria bacterium]|nr:type-F conjugative transfer system protein TrbI [Gammaproteobacteria bacterium]